MEGETVRTGTILPDDEVIIRKAHPDDLPGICMLLEAESGEWPPADQLLRDGFEHSLPWFHILLAETRGETVGAAMYYRTYWSWTGRTLFLHSLCVRKSLRRRGVGSRLLRELCQVALKENAQLDWFCPPSDTAARSFFAQFKPNINQNIDGTYVMRITPQNISEAFKSREGMNEEVSVRMACREDMVQLDMMIHSPQHVQISIKTANVLRSLFTTTCEIDETLYTKEDKEISAFQELADGPELHVKDLVKDAFTSLPPWFFALVAYRRGSVVGAVIGNRVYTGWSRGFYLQNLYVRPCARRSGIADQLIVEFGRIAEKDNAEYIDFNVAPENTPAEALYRRYRAARVATFDGQVAYRFDKNSLKEVVTQQ